MNLEERYDDDVWPYLCACHLADQRLCFLAVHRELDDRAGGLDPVQRLLEGLGLELKRLRFPSVAVDHRGHLTAEARLARAALSGGLPGTRRERNSLSHTLSVVRCPFSRRAS